MVLGIDIGSTNTKVVLADVADGVRPIRVGRVATPADGPGLVDAVAALVHDCVAATPSPVAAIGITSMAETGVAFDRSGQPLTPLLRWDRADAAGRDRLTRLLERHPDLPERSGLPATPKPALVALLGLRAEAPETFTRLARWQGIADLVAAALTGAHATDHTLAARTMLVADPDDPGRRRWDAGLLAELGLADGVMPRILAAGEPAGETGDMAAPFGLAPGIPVYIAGHDHAVGAWAAGVRAPGAAADSLGTAEAVMAVTAAAQVAAVRDGFSVGRTVDDRHATLMGGSPACGSLLAQWPGSPVDRLSRYAADEWHTSPVTVLPYPSGRQCPAPDPTATLRVLGGPQSPEGDERALLQSLVLHARWMRRAMAQHAAESPERVVMLGSLTERVPVWAPLTAAAEAEAAAVLRCTAAEPVAMGAALLAAVRAGLAPDDAVLPLETVTPCRAGGLDDAYQRLLDAALDSHLPATPPPAIPHPASAEPRTTPL